MNKTQRAAIEEAIGVEEDRLARAHLESQASGKNATRRNIEREIAELKEGFYER